MARSKLIIEVLLLCVVVAAPRPSSAGGSYLKFFSFKFNGSFWFCAELRFGAFVSFCALWGRRVLGLRWTVS